MEKGLTLKRAFIECKKMWKWISDRCEDGPYEWDSCHVFMLKRTYAQNMNLKLTSNCFFCEFNDGAMNCKNCPGKMIDPDFHCQSKKFNYQTNPIDFYKEIVRLNKIRRAKGIK